MLEEREVNPCVLGDRSIAFSTGSEVSDASEERKTKRETARLVQHVNRTKPTLASSCHPFTGTRD